MSEITLRDGTVVKHYASIKQNEEYWEIMYPDGDKTKVTRPYNHLDALRTLDEKFPAEQNGNEEDTNDNQRP